MKLKQLNKSVADLINLHASTRPDKVAFRSTSAALTFAELEIATRRFAARIPRGARVLICLPAELFFVVAVLGTTRAAAIAIPVDPRSSTTALHELVADIGPSLVVTDEAHRAQIPAQVPVVTAAATSPWGDGDDVPCPPDDLGLDHVAYIYYSSGTTGRPKAIPSGQRPWVDRAFALGERLGLGEQDRVLWPLPLHHALAHSHCLMKVLTTGAEAHITDSDSKSLIEALRTYDPTMLVGVPTTYHGLVLEGRAIEVPSLRLCVSAGSAAPKNIRDAVRVQFGLPLLSAYGATETCGPIAAQVPGDDVDLDGACGRPISEVRIDEKTQQVLVRVDEVRWYHTGDLGSLADDGQLVITGRVKDVIIRGGVNVHPAEIERALLDFPGVSDAAVAGRPHHRLGEVAVGYVVASASSKIDVEKLFAFCRRRLPAPKVPDEIRVLDSIPRGTLGKILRSALPDLEDEHDHDPVVIVAMSARYPGGIGSPEDLWAAVRDEVDVIGPFPSDRGWDAPFHPDPDRAGAMYVRSGGFLEDAANFDPVPFGIHPREAIAMAPDHRLVLEEAWKLWERAGIDPAELRGSDTSVYLGMLYHGGYKELAKKPSAELESYLGLGSAASVASGRIAYTFGLHGQAVTVDTACSSSLVALHQAVRSLRSGECQMAIAGGVSVMSTPSPFVTFSRLQALAPDGRVKAFSASADGTAWSEGAGLLLLTRLSEAHRRGLPMLAVVRGTAVGSDGASNGLTAPNGPAQQRVIRAALRDARLRSADVDAVDAHGTGTQLGDPIEAHALLATYGRDRPAGSPLYCGSVKSNLGHTQAAAGMAGVIKMVMAMRAGVLPRSINISEPSRSVDWDAGNVALLTSARPWPRSGRPRRAAVSAFGISGTNSHVIIEQAPLVSGSPEKGGGDGGLAWFLSAAGKEALSAKALQLHDFVAADTALSLPAVAAAVGVTRAALRYRAVFSGGDRPAVLRALSAIVTDAQAQDVDVVRGVASSAPPRVVFVFSGQGAQRPLMGTDLISLPAFRGVFYDTIACLESAGVSGLGAALQDPSAPIHRTELAQPALFAYQVALYQLLASWGIRPDILIGHSIGELAVAHVSGVLTRTDAAILVAARARLMGAVPKHGAMVQISAPENVVVEALAESNSRASIAAVNGARGVVISGDVEAVEAVTALIAEKGFPNHRRLSVSHAFHSADMDAVLDEFARVAAGLSYSSPQITVISTKTGKPAANNDLQSAEYWARQLREPVRFADAVRAAFSAGVTAFVELSPTPALTAAILSLTPSGAPDPTVVNGSSYSSPGQAMDLIAGKLWSVGVPLDRAAVLGPVDSSVAASLPTYPFRRRRFWVADENEDNEKTISSSPTREESGVGDTSHPLIDRLLDFPGSNRRCATAVLSLANQPWLGDHRLDGEIVIPAAVLVEMVLGMGVATLSELVNLRPLFLHSDPVEVLVVLDETRVEIHARERGCDEWEIYASGRAEIGVKHHIPRPSSAPSKPWAQRWPPFGLPELDPTALYSDSVVIEYGLAFRGVRRLWHDGGDIVFAEIELPQPGAASSGYNSMHPALLDIALHPAQALGGHGSQIPFVWTGVRQFRSGNAARVRITAHRPDRIEIQMADNNGAPMLEIDSLILRSTSTHLQPPNRHLYRPAWTQVPAPTHQQHQQLTTEVRTLRLEADPTKPAAAQIQQAATQLRDAMAELPSSARLVILTTNATGPDAHPMSATLSGFAHVATAEYLGRVSYVDVDESPASADAISSAIAATTSEPRVRIDNGAVLTCRLVRANIAPDDGGLASTLGVGPVLITGGTGALGLLVARHLVVAHGVRKIVLVGRRGPAALDQDAPQLAAEWTANLDGTTAADVDIRILAADMADRASAEKVLATTRPDQLTCIIHAAGVVGDGTIDSSALLTASRIDAVLRPKMLAATHLHELTSGANRTKFPRLSGFVLFSSASGILGNAGQAAYAAANSFLDALAQQRRAEQLPALSLCWGPWDVGSGMAAPVLLPDGSVRGGIRGLTVDEGLAALDAALRTRDEAVLVPIVVKTGAVTRAHIPPAFWDLVSPPPRHQRPSGLSTEAKATPTSPSNTAATRLRRLARDELVHELTLLIRNEMVAELGYGDAGLVEAGVAFTDQGLDSVASIRLRSRLVVATGVKMPATVVFDQPSPVALAEWLAARVVGGG